MPVGEVEVHVRLDGSIVVFDGQHELSVAPAPLDPVQLRAARGRREEPGIEPEPATLAWVPPAEHPWRRVRRDTALYQTRLTESLSSDTAVKPLASGGTSVTHRSPGTPGTRAPPDSG